VIEVFVKREVRLFLFSVGTGVMEVFIVALPFLKSRIPRSRNRYQVRGSIEAQRVREPYTSNHLCP